MDVYEVLLRLQGEAGSMVRAIQEGTAELTGLDGSILATKGFIKDLNASEIRIQVDPAGLAKVEIATNQIRALKGIAASGITVPIRADWQPGIVAALRSAGGRTLASGQNPNSLFNLADVLAAWSPPSATAPAAPGGGDTGRLGIGGILASILFGGLGGRGRGGKGAGSKSLLWGGGSGLPFLGAMAGAGSLGMFAGFGPERVIMTGAGLAGSLAGGAIGGGLLAAGTGATMAVGSGSDLLVQRTAADNLKNVVTAQTAMNTAIAQYGPASQQAIDATKAYKFAISQLPPAMQASTTALSTMQVATTNMWQNASAQGQIAANSIKTQWLALRQAFIPAVAAAAQQNLGIINQGLKPLFAWLKGPEGMAIFQNLEHIFASRLPTALHTLDQFVQVVIKSLDYLANKTTGGLTRWLDGFFTKINGSGWGDFTKKLDTLVGMFRTWSAFFIILGKDIFQIFGQAAGMGTSVATILTGMLTQLHDWLTQSGGNAQLHSVFTAHLGELKAILGLIPPIVSALGQMYLSLAPILTGWATFVVTTLSPVIKWVASNPFTAWIAAIGIVLLKLGLMGPIIKATGITALLAKIPLIGGLFSGGASSTAMKAALIQQSAADTQLRAAEINAANRGIPGAPGGPPGGPTSLPLRLADLLPEAGALLPMMAVLAPLAAASAASLLIPKYQAPGANLTGTKAITADFTANSLSPGGGGSAAGGALAHAGQVQINLQDVIDHIKSMGLSTDVAAKAAQAVAVAWNAGDRLPADINRIINNVQAQAVSAQKAANAQSIVDSLGLTGDQASTFKADIMSGLINTSKTSTELLTAQQLWGSANGDTATFNNILGAFSSQAMGIKGALAGTQANATEAVLLSQDGVTGFQNIADGVNALADLQTRLGPVIGNNMAAVSALWALNDHNMVDLTKAAQTLNQVQQTTGPLSANEQWLYAQAWGRGVHGVQALTDMVTAVQTVEQQTGPVTMQQMGIFNDLWVKGVHDTGKLTADMLLVQQISSTKTPMTVASIAAMEADLAKGVTDVNQIQADMAAAQLAADKADLAGKLSAAGIAIAGVTDNANFIANLLTSYGLTGALATIKRIAAGLSGRGPTAAAGGADIPGFSGGGGPLPGFSWVGEQGPELAEFPYGAHVYPHGVSMAMARRASIGVTPPITFAPHFEVNGITSEQVIPAMRREIGKWHAETLRLVRA